jgi:hypothetical protein
VSGYFFHEPAQEPYSIIFVHYTEYRVSRKEDPYLTNFPLLRNITFSPFAGGGKVMGTQRVRPGGSQVFFFLYFPWCEILGGILKFLLVILIEETRELGLVTYSQAARKDKSNAGS